MKVSGLKIISNLCFIVCIIICIVAYVIFSNEKDKDLVYEETAISNKNTENVEETKEEQTKEEETIETVSVEQTQTEEIVYDGLTLEELSNKLDRTLASNLSGKGALYASYSLERGVDPYLAVAISMEETGCTWGCSNLVTTCNNVGGMKGSGCGSYGYFNTLDDGIKAFIDNIANNYVAYGLTTADLMNPKYAENPMWSTNVNAYIDKIKNN